MQKSVRDIGSMFHQVEAGDDELKNLLYPEAFLEEGSYGLFYTGRHAIFSILNEIISQRKIRKIWLPRYFCLNVLNAVTLNYKNVFFYDIDPFQVDFNFNLNSFAQANDVVLLNNYWGLKTYKYPKSKDERPIIIEDHSHGWHSTASKNSKADYAVCSLRKSYPIPLGAIAWKPNGHDFSPVYKKIKNKEINTAYEVLRHALKLKREYLLSGDEKLQLQFLKLLDEGEKIVSTSSIIEEPNPELIKILNYYIHFNPNHVKYRNLSLLYRLLQDSKYFKILKNIDLSPFGLLLLFKDAVMFKEFKQFMIEHQIYPANLWPNNSLNAKWKHFYNIHVDFRYSSEDMEYLASKINSWSPTK